MKKIIAREFLILIACALAFGLAFIGTVSYNFVIESRIDKFEITLQSFSDSIKTMQTDFPPKIENKNEFSVISKTNRRETKQWTYKDKVYDVLSSIYKKRGAFDKLPSKEVFYKKIKSEGERYVKKVYASLYLIYKEQGATDKIPDENTFLSRFDLKGMPTPSEPLATTGASSAEKIINEKVRIESKIRTEKHKLLNFDDRLEFSLKSLMIIGVLSFPLRYLLYAIKWSIKTLKQKE